ncbi:MAG: GNAT family N-acetyltransferase, partial [Caulobacteraceae bacterium]
MFTALHADDLLADPNLGDALLRLNNDHAVELSLLDAAGLRRLVGAAFLALRAPPAEALLIAFDQDAAYDSPNFLWFRERYARFVYVDRVV